MTPKELDANKAYRKSDKYKAYHKAYWKSDAYKTSENLRYMKDHYLKQKGTLEKTLKHYSIPPIPLQGKLLSINNLLANIEIIEKHVAGLNADSQVKRETMNTMIENLMEKEGVLVSMRKAIR